jgi:hypothetical protein
VELQASFAALAENFSLMSATAKGAFCDELLKASVEQSLLG